jgi:hypothetical protein
MLIDEALMRHVKRKSNEALIGNSVSTASAIEVSEAFWAIR